MLKIKPTGNRRPTFNRASHVECSSKINRIFAENIDILNGGQQELKSKHFARALTIIYALQSSLDFERAETLQKIYFNFTICSPKAYGGFEYK